MNKRLLQLIVALCVLALPMQSLAMRVLCLGDSQTTVWSGYKSSYCDILDEMRDDIETVNAGVPSDTTAGAFERLKIILENEHFDIVVIFIGTNDWTLWQYNDRQPIYTARAIRKMARYALHYDAKHVVVMTLLPSLQDARHEFDRLVSEKLLKYRWPLYHKKSIVDLFHFFNGRWDSENTYDGVHITIYAAEQIADLLADTIPTEE